MIGTLLLKATEEISWLGAFFHSVSARTAGFSTYSIGSFTNAGLFVLIILMFIGASPGSTGGGIKTTTFFALMQEVRTVISKRRAGRVPPHPAGRSAAQIFCDCTAVRTRCMHRHFPAVHSEPEYDFIQLVFEVVSAFGTVGLSTGITPDLGVLSKLIIILTMYTGRLGAFTLLSIWINRPDPSAHYTEEQIMIG